MTYQIEDDGMRRTLNLIAFRFFLVAGFAIKRQKIARRSGFCSLPLNLSHRCRTDQHGRPVGGMLADAGPNPTRCAGVSNFDDAGIVAVVAFSGSCAVFPIRWIPW
jgi:hypothetical protein